MLQYTQNMAVAYLLRKMPHTFATAVRVFTEIKFRLPLAKFENFLDFGAGLGSGAYAFFDMFPECKSLIACEPSAVMRKLGKHITQVCSTGGRISMRPRAIHTHTNIFFYVVNAAVESGGNILHMPLPART